VSTRVAYDVEKLRWDLAERGWLPTDLARAAEVSDMTVSRFLSGQRQTARTAAKLAKALGKTVRRYLVRSGEAA
jgi:plasmid maintenance system antidote protein VapI